MDHVGCMTKSKEPWSGLPYLGREEFVNKTLGQMESESVALLLDRC